jgi:hypothetical protein
MFKQKKDHSLSDLLRFQARQSRRQELFRNASASQGEIESGHRFCMKKAKFSRQSKGR